MSGLELVVLGSGGPFVQPERASSSCLVVHADHTGDLPAVAFAAVTAGGR